MSSVPPGGISVAVQMIGSPVGCLRETESPSAGWYLLFFFSPGTRLLRRQAGTLSPNSKTSTEDTECSPESSTPFCFSQVCGWLIKCPTPVPSTTLLFSLQVVLLLGKRCPQSPVLGEYHSFVPQSPAGEHLWGGARVGLRSLSYSDESECGLCPARQLPVDTGEQGGPYWR